MQFTLIVDEFGVKYVGKEHALHLKQTIGDNYTVKLEWDVRQYIGIILDWEYKRRQVHLLIPNYVTNTLKKFNHKLQKTKHQPYPSAPIKYGAKKQYATQKLTAPLLGVKGKKFIQQVCGKFLFLGQAVDSTILSPISAIASQSSSPT